MREDSAGVHRLPALAPGAVRLPPSKSEVLRALLIASASRRELELRCAEGASWDQMGEDIKSGLDCARALGASLDQAGGTIKLTPGGPGPVGGALPVGEAGFLGRAAPTCAALCRGGTWLIEARGSLKARRSAALWAALTSAGVEVIGRDGWPSAINMAGELGALGLSRPSSSQELSALWMALACSGGGRVAVEGEVPSGPYLRMTQSALSRFGASVQDGDGGFVVTGVNCSPSAPVVVEVDASAAAVALAAGCIGDVPLEVPSPATGSLQGDWRIVEYLGAFGCAFERSGGALVAAGGPTHGADLDLSGEPDLAPPLAAVAAHVAIRTGEGSALRGLHTLDGKESPRGRVLQAGLRQAGVSCVWRDPVLEIGPSYVDQGAQVLDSCGDHRMAFAFALLGITLPRVSVGQGFSIAKSWPGFWSSMTGASS